jgi:protein-tyrosine phosphatase
MTERPPNRLPEPRRSGRHYRIAVVCLGNICRSPIAEVVLTSRLEEAGLSDAVDVASAGTGDWHLGQPMDRRAARTLSSRGYDGHAHRARQTEPDWVDSHDLVLAMDGNNYTDLLALGVAPERLRRFRDFDPDAEEVDRDVPDPYYGGDDGFDEVLTIIERTSDQLVAELSNALEER